ncbi:hypothetical protein TWF106_000256 [Orbilia oligospora]|uniref:Uncharacterized protein n=1 Tax=Orbilia oligospora TaxID=2813651 RepID=A0A7C8QX37_ORBOL|nr:hypothetical protein TWF679_001918 [Orbilia oligospora]KAF3226514.1 hypothetical protein TWF106_000256 [Orbilia oligospora]
MATAMITSNPTAITPHPDLPKAQTDANAYILGSIGCHNVVITCLPMDCYGTNQTTRAAAQMLNTFSSVKITLMVGIGAGIPTKVKLGDVVISTEWTQWDSGKTKNGVFEHVGKRYFPPEELSCAMSKLQAEHNLDETKIQQQLDKLRSENQKLSPKYTSIENCGNSEGHPHQGGENGASQIYKGSNNARVHYGLIASGNQVVKDASLRDEIDSRLQSKVLCIEMEAAGLMKFPAVIVRGICDYADETKNDDWQEYAATVAAICGKELLNCVHPSSTSTVHTELISGDPYRFFHQYEGKNPGYFDYSLGPTLTRKDNLTKEEEREIISHLPVDDFSAKQNSLFKRRQRGTGQWFLNSPEYQTWLKEKGILFCQGIPGVGKTIMTSIVIDDLTERYSNDMSVGIAYVYFGFKDTAQLSLEHLMLSLVKQLALRQPLLPSCIRDILEWKKGTFPLSQDIRKSLFNVIAFHSRTFIIIDALDECRNDLAAFLEVLFTLRQDQYINIFATLRYIPEIEDRFSGISIQLEIRAIEEDVRNYLESQILQRGTRVLKNNKAIVQEEIWRAAQGMFLLAHLYFESIKNKLTMTKINKALESLASGDGAYDRIYQDIMDRITEQDLESRNLAYKILSWITYATRPLKKEELQRAVAVELDETEIEEINRGVSRYEFNFDPRDVPEIEDMISVCCGLITVDAESGVVRLVHYTTQEYFERTGSVWFPQANGNIAAACIILMSLNISSRAVLSGSYSVNNWLGHILESTKEESYGSPTKLGQEGPIFLSLGKVKLQPLVLGFFQKHHLRLAYTKHMRYARKSTIPRVPGSDVLFQEFIWRGMRIYTYLALYLAELLIRWGMIPQPKPDGDAEQEMLFPSQIGPGGFVGFLAKHSIYILRGEVVEDPEDMVYFFSKGFVGSALEWAVITGNREILRNIIDMDIEGVRSNACARTDLLALAVGKGYYDIAELLLEGKDLKAPIYSNGGTILSAAAVKSNNGVLLEVLLDKGSEIETKNNLGMTPLSLAIENRKIQNIIVLLERGADFRGQGEDKDRESNQLLLEIMTKHGKDDIVKSLIERGIFLKLGNSALGYIAWAIGKGQRFSRNAYDLLQSSRRPDVQNLPRMDLSILKTLLKIAGERPREEFLELLLESGVPADEIAEAMLKEPLDEN